MTPAKLADVVAQARLSESQHRRFSDKPNPLVKDTAIVALADERDRLAVELARYDAADKMNNANHDALLRRLDDAKTANAKLVALLEIRRAGAMPWDAASVEQWNRDVSALLAEIKAGA